jgi:CDP-glycerol glycerophosphotransferase (TagB/SpsB family)
VRGVTLRRGFRAARRIDRAIGHLKGRRRVLIEVRSPMNLEVLRPIWSALAADSRIALTFTAEEDAWVRPSLEAAGLAARMVTHTQATWQRFDLACNADPWNALPLKRCWKRINFFHGVAGKYDLDDAKAIGEKVDFDAYDCVMFANEDRLRRYVDGGIVPASRAALIGFPKADDLVNGRWTAATLRAELGLDPSIETVLYAPTFSPASSLHLAGERIIDALLATGRNVIVKLHERSTVPHPKYTDDVDWPARLARFVSRPRYAYATGAHVGPYLTAADVLVTDHSTVGFEFALLDRPIVVFDAPDLLQFARINPEKWMQLRSMADVVHRVEDLPGVLSRALASPRRHSAERRAMSQALFAHAGHATERALEVVYDLIELSVVPDASAVRKTATVPEVQDVRDEVRA